MSGSRKSPRKPRDARERVQVTSPSTPFGKVASAVATWPGPSWLTDARKAAMNRFAAAGLPSTRLEAWRTTPLPDLGTEAFVAGAPSTATVASDLVSRFAVD